MRHDVRDAYNDLVKQYARAPHRKGAPSCDYVSARASNPVCGDRVEVFVSTGASPELVEVHFDGRACAICIASASMMTRALSGVVHTEARVRASRMVRALEEPDAHALPEEAGVRLEELEALGAVQKLKARRRCASLPWSAVGDALAQYDSFREERGGRDER